MFSDYQFEVVDDNSPEGFADPVLDAAVSGMTSNVPICGAFSAAAPQVVNQATGVPGASGTPLLTPAQQAILNQRADGTWILANPVNSKGDMLMILGLCVGAYFLFRNSN